MEREKRAERKRRIGASVILSLVLTTLPIPLVALWPPHLAGTISDRVLSILAGPGLMLATSLFGIHNLGFFLLTPVVNFVFWSAIIYATGGVYGRLRRS